MHVEHMRELRDFLTTLPAYKIQMQGYVFKRPSTDAHSVPDDEPVHKCNTVGCIAGWATMLHEPFEAWQQRFAYKDHPKGEWKDYADWADINAAYTAQRWLNLSSDEASHIFTGGWSNQQLSDIPPEDVIAYLTACIDNECVVWSTAIQTPYMACENDEGDDGDGDGDDDYDDRQEDK
jgi:hypothetical protein